VRLRGRRVRARRSAGLALLVPAAAMLAGFRMPLPPTTIGGVTRVAQVTGPGSVNDTARRWDVYGADLGHMVWHEGSLYMVFGDTFGPDGGDWRSNTMARIASPVPSSGLHFASMVTGPGGGAAELLGSEKVDGVEKTVIPTYGISVGTRMYLHYMSVRHWGAPGQWQINYSGLAWSDDGGRTWVKDPAARWPADSNFGQVAMVQQRGTIYLFGIPAGRQGGVQVARVDQADLLNLGDYRYWDGRAWSTDASSAATVVPAPVGELSVRWSAYLGRWLMMYLDENRSAVVLRTAAQLTGPWSSEQVVATAADYPELYAPYLVPVETGRDIYFTMSQYGPYEVYLMRARLP
jgi:hypothetical protein